MCVRENECVGEKGSNFERIDVVICNLCKEGRVVLHDELSFPLHWVWKLLSCAFRFYLKNDYNSV